MSDTQEIIENLNKINDKLGKMHKIEGNLESLEFFELTMELLIENYHSFTKKDLEEILMKVRKMKREKIDEMDIISSK